MIFAAGGDVGGGKTHILSIARELSKNNELRLVSFYRSFLSHEAREMGLDVADIEGTAPFKEGLAFALAQFDEFKPDIVHCHGGKANVYGAFLKQRRNCCICSTVHSDPKLDYLGEPIKQYTNGNANQWALRRMDYLVAVAGRMKEILIERGFDPYKVYTIYNGMDFSDAPAEPKPQKHGDEPVVVGILARLNPVKDIETVVRAVAKAYAKDKRLRLSIAGNGEDKAKLEALVKELGIEDVTVFEGWITDVRAYFDRVDINVLASLSETFPYSLLEGAYVHCPAIASNVGGIPYLIEQGVTGYLFEPGDSDTFSEHILRLAADPELRTALGEALFRKAGTEFSLERMARDQQEAYRSMLRKNKMPKRSGVVLCGAYGRGNAGDEAILRAILNELRAVDPDMPFWVMSRDPKGTSKKEGVRSFYIFNVLKMIRSLRKAKLFVNGGGTLIQDITSTRSLNFYLFTLIAAKKLGCRVIMYGCGIGPLGSESNRRHAGKVLDGTADIITVRDSGSLELLRDIGVSRPEMTLAADPTVNLPPLSEDAVNAAFREEGIPSDIDMIAFCMRDWKSFTDRECVAKAADYAWEKYGLTPVFIPFEVPRDTEITADLAGMVKAPHYVCSRAHSVGEYTGMLGRMRLVCGMRLHSLIFATAGGAPVVGVSYDVKVDSFIRDIGSDALIPLEDLSFDALKAQIDAVLARGSAGGEATRKRLMDMEKKNAEAAARLLSE
ncbi:MAG: polysaccharide pyruvyl transferase CsaB [Firmicutes bacterium]|nr:polysaccharide pyruvyl transferase CsaB [Bacillota bacterium]